MKEIIVEGEMIDDGELILKQPTPEEIRELADEREILIKTKIKDNGNYTASDIVYIFPKSKEKIPEEVRILSRVQEIPEEHELDKLKLENHFDDIVVKHNKLVDYIKAKERE